MKYLIVEPHADDAFLSLGHHLGKVWRGNTDCAIVTLFPETVRRAEEGQAFAFAVGCEYFTKNAETEQPFDTLKRVVKHFNPDQIVGPLGIQHPQHVEVHHMIRGLVKRSVAWYYLDTPYQLKLKNADAVNTALFGTTPVSYATCPATKWKHVPLFRSQAKFFHFNPPEHLARAPELIVERLP